MSRGASRPGPPRGARTRLFVYGTLRPDAAPASVRGLVAGARSLGAATVPGRLHDLGAYPAAVLGAGPGVVRGELLEIARAALPALDAYEGVERDAPGRSLFRRVRCRARLAAEPAGAARSAWIYVWNGEAPPGPVVPGGAWDGRAALRARRREG